MINILNAIKPIQKTRHSIRTERFCSASLTFFLGGWGLFVFWGLFCGLSSGKSFSLLSGKAIKINIEQ
jgi:hypothetical protein